ncbi:MAG: glycoside hydrolase family 13 protein, partial [Eggerthellaceae bacterium]|nr:glycoside hydrolase family 13 protein [Eggerthellaceae bacterium]
SVSVRVGEIPEGSARPLWRDVQTVRSGNGFVAELVLGPRPHVALYAFVLRIADGEEFLYVPRADGRSTFGELAREGVDGHWTDEGWRWHAWRVPSCGPRDFGVPGPLGGFQITVYDSSFATPDWLRGAVMYQIFPDRFARGEGGVREEGIAYHEAMARPVKLHASWDEPADWEGVSWMEARRPGQDGKLPFAYDPVDFFGGTLEGIREKLPYLASLGVEVLYLNPCFEARSNHRYDTADYLHIDPLLGPDEDFAELCAAARKHGIAILLDAVMSHTGADSRYFNARGTYPETGAMQNAASPYRGWYDFTPMDEVTPYRCWWGDPSLPEVDERNPSWQRFMLGDAEGNPVVAAEQASCERFRTSEKQWYNPPQFFASSGLSEQGTSSAAPKGVLPRWIGRGAAGYRIDVADEIPDDVLERIRASVKGADASAAIIGEVWEDTTSKGSYGAARTYALGRALDSVMNYPLRNALLGFALGTVDAHRLAAFLNLQAANYPPAMHACLMNLLSSHDVERVRSVLALGGQLKQETRAEQRRLVAGITPDDDARAARLQRMTAALLYALPGAPCIYYGDEAGLQGGGDPFCRETFPWNPEARELRTDCSEDLTAFYQKLGQLRKGSPVLRAGASFSLACGDDVVCVVRVDDVGAMIALANRANAPQGVVVDLLDVPGKLPALNTAEGRLCAAIFSSADTPECSATLQNGILQCLVPPQATLFLTLGKQAE